MNLYNSLTRKKEEFKPLNPPNVGMYTCGPTVYDYATIGNFRTYTMADILVRALKVNGYQVKYVINLTDVGHLTGDNLGNADTGEDRIEKAAKKEGKSAWDIARFYKDVFWSDFRKLNLTQPNVWARATEHIPEQIDLVEKLEGKGFTYKTVDGIYFNTIAFEKKTGKRYGELSTLDEIEVGARVEPNPEKKNPRDFALWKFSETPGVRQMEWNSPWGSGFPGWHIECSAMSMKYLGGSFDIHVGGEDLRQTHHPNEIAQSEAVTSQKFVNYWIHSAFLLVNKTRMSKSLGNAYTVADIQQQEFNPLALRYLYLTAHYRDHLNFTWESLKAAQNTYDKLVNFMAEPTRKEHSEKRIQLIRKLRDEFFNQINNDLGTPGALAVLWKVIKSNIPDHDKKELLLSFDEVLGLKLEKVANSQKNPFKVPQKVRQMVEQREQLRKKGEWEKADNIRKKVESVGYTIIDTMEGTVIKKKKSRNIQ